jgi:hypothetical protein
MMDEESWYSGRGLRLPLLRFYTFEKSRSIMTRFLAASVCLGLLVAMPVQAQPSTTA